MKMEQDSFQQQSVGESAAVLTEQYLTFYMKDEEFGVNILSVQEIRGWESVTSIPNSPGHVLGVMNLRGTVVPVIDLRMCFGLEELSYGEETVVIIINLQCSGSSKVLGIVVDAVSDVHNFGDADIQPSPELSSKDQGQFIKGLGSTKEKMVILLNLTESIFGSELNARPLH